VDRSELEDLLEQAELRCRHVLDEMEADERKHERWVRHRRRMRSATEAVASARALVVKSQADGPAIRRQISIAHAHVGNLRIMSRRNERVRLAEAEHLLDEALALLDDPPI